MYQSQQQENHPFLIGFNMASGITAWIVLLAGCSTFSESQDGATTFLGILLFLAALVLFWGVIWLGTVSDSFHKWSQMSGGKQLLGCLILLPGILLGIVIVVALYAIGVELGRKD